jgi:glycosyltransferase involved in cell wall biosynthesis
MYPVQDNSRGQSYWDADVVMTEAAAKIHDVQATARPYDDSLIDLTCFVSCYNEAQYIVGTLTSICSAMRESGRSFEIIVIDDASKDNSRELVREFIAANPDERIVLRANKKNKGLAQNYIDGAFIGRGKYYRFFSGDDAEPIHSIVTLVKSIGDADCIVPYYNFHGRSAGRLLLSIIYTRVINAVSGNRLHYYNGPTIHFRHNVMRWHSNTRGFGFQAEILCLLISRGFTYKEVNIDLHERRQGKSNALTRRNILSVVHSVLEIAIRRIGWLIDARQK